MKLLIRSKTSTVEPLKLGMDKQFQSTRSTECDYLSMLEFKLDQISKRDYRCHLMRKNSPDLCLYIHNVFSSDAIVDKKCDQLHPNTFAYGSRFVVFCGGVIVIGFARFRFWDFTGKILFPSKVA